MATPTFPTNQSPGSAPASAGGQAWRRIELLGVPIDALTETQCVAHIVDELAVGHGGWVVTANLDHLRRLVKLDRYRALCAGASLVTADGMPLLWAARVQGTPLPERVTGSNLIWSLSAAAAQFEGQKSPGMGGSVFLLGGDPGTAEGAGKVLEKRYPGARVAGTACPPVGFEQDAALVAALRAQLVASRPDIVLVALGSPKQEQFIADYRTLLPSAWWLGVGISFSFVTGDVARAPRWMQRLGLEWLHRLCQEPKRLAKRYLVDDLPFAVELLAHCAWARLFGRAKGAGDPR